MKPIDIQIQDHPIDPQALRDTIPELPDCGGFASFEGLVRNTNHGRKVEQLDYEAYDTLALKEIKRICIAVFDKHKTKFIRVIHRKGSLRVGQTAVIIQVLSPHRAEAFAACQEIIDKIKKDVPIWKREIYSDNTYAWTRCNHSSDDLKT